MISPDERIPKPTTLLRAYFRIVYSKILKARDSKRIYESAIDSLEKFVGRPVPLKLINGKLLAKWVKHVIENRYGTSKTAYQWRKRIIMIVERALPDAQLIEVEPPAEGTILHLFESRYRPERMLGCRRGSILQVKVTISVFGTYLGRTPVLSDFNQSTVAGFLGWSLESGLAVPTVNCRRGNLMAIWRYAWKRSLVIEPPEGIDKLREYRRLPNSWTVEELSTLVNAAMNLKGKLVKRADHRTLRRPEYRQSESMNAADWWAACLVTAYDTGLRLSALLAIEWRNVDFEGGTIRVEAETQKQRTEQRFKVSDQCAELLRKIRNPPYRSLLFPWPLSKYGFHRWLKTILKAAGLPDGPKDKMHKIRRTTATRITVAAGLEAASKHLGHSSAELTKRYVDVTQTGDRDGSIHLPRLALNEGK